MSSWWSNFKSKPSTQKLQFASGIVGIGTTFALASLYIRRKYKSQLPNNFFTTADVAANNMNLSGKYAIVTGSNQGIGKETVRVLIAHGCTVCMACRSLTKANQCRQELITQFAPKQDVSSQLFVLQLDLSSLQSVKQFVDQYTALNQPLHYLINNAGVSAVIQFKRGETYTLVDGIEQHLLVNYVAPYYLTRALLPLMKQSANSRVINVSSMTHAHQTLEQYTQYVRSFEKCFCTEEGLRTVKQRNFVTYSVSKCCKISFTQELNRRYGGSVVAVSLHPGGVHTQMVKDILDNCFSKWFKYWFVYVKSPLMGVMKSVAQGAATTIHCVALADNEIVPGGYYDDCDVAQLKGPFLSDQVAIQDVNKELWQVTEKLLVNRGFLVDVCQT